MKTLMVAFLVGIMCFAPVLAAAQSGSSGGSMPSSSGKSSPSGTSGGAGSSGSGSSTTPGASSGSSGSSSSPAASPSGASTLPYTTKAECEKAGGMWQATASKCEKK